MRQVSACRAWACHSADGRGGTGEKPASGAPAPEPPGLVVCFDTTDLSATTLVRGSRVADLFHKSILASRRKPMSLPRLLGA
jgi:hypothetical protein